MILILTGPVRSHKTTTLHQWALSRNDCGGILTPDEHGLRTLYNVKDRKSIPFQLIEKKSEADLTIGKFIFDADGINIAISWLNEHLLDPHLQYMILDEIGPLELGGEGWDKWLQNALQQISDKTLILVVRQNLLNEVIQHYNLKDVTVVDKDYFIHQPNTNLLNI